MEAYMHAKELIKNTWEKEKEEKLRTNEAT